jgi:hypothetical protein
MKPVTADRVLFVLERVVSETATKRFSELFQITRKTKFNEGRRIRRNSAIRLDGRNASVQSEVLSGERYRWTEDPCLGSTQGIRDPDGNPFGFLREPLMTFSPAFSAHAPALCALISTCGRNSAPLDFKELDCSVGRT